MSNTDAPPSGAELMRLEQVAEKLGVSFMTVRRLVATGKLKSLKLSAHTIRYRRTDVEAYLKGTESHETPQNNPAPSATNM
jgi:excisionase family DNA binding protein